MLKNPIPKVTKKLQYRAIGIINGKFIPKNSEQLNRGLLTDNKGEKIETVVLGKALSLIKKHFDLKKSYYWIVYPKNKNTQNLHLQVAGIWDPYQLNDFQNDSSKTNFSKLLEELEIDTSTKTEDDSSALPTNPFELVEMIRRQNSMNDATNPSDAIDDALKSFNGLEEKQEI